MVAFRRDALARIHALKEGYPEFRDLKVHGSYIEVFFDYVQICKYIGQDIDLSAYRSRVDWTFNHVQNAFYFTFTGLYRACGDLKTEETGRLRHFVVNYVRLLRSGHLI